MGESPRNLAVRDKSKDEPYDLAPGLWDLGNPDSIYNLLDPGTQDRFLDARMRKPELFDIGENELRERLKTMGRSEPTVIENQMRMRFWNEYEAAVADGRKMRMSNVTRGACAPEVFRNYTKKPESVAWISCAPVSYESHLLELLNHGAHRMRELLRANAINPDGTVNVKLAELQRKIYEAAELRAHGAIPQTIRQLNLNIDGPRAVNQAIEERGSFLLEDKISLLEKKPVVKKPSQVVEEKVEDES